MRHLISENVAKWMAFAGGKWVLNTGIFAQIFASWFYFFITLGRDDDGACRWVIC
jgi:hypothetical protein